MNEDTAEDRTSPSFLSSSSQGMREKTKQGGRIRTEGRARRREEEEEEGGGGGGTMYGVAAAILRVLPPGLMFQKCCIQTKQG